MDEAECKAYRIASAYDEAGHAVIAALHRLLGESVRLDSSEDCSGAEAGETRFKPYVDRNLDDVRRDKDGYIRIAVAGREAQAHAILTGLIPYYSSERERQFAAMKACSTDLHDRQMVAALLRHLGEAADKKAVEAQYDDGAAPEVQAMLARPEVWAAVHSVAERLVEDGELKHEQVLVLVRATGVSLTDN